MRKDIFDERLTLPASQGVVDPKYRLCCAVLTQAIKDLHDRRYPLMALDALLWLAGGEAYQWADSLGYFVPDGELVSLAARGKV